MTLGQFREMTQYLPDSVELNIAHGDEYFPANCFVGRGNTLALCGRLNECRKIA